MKEEVSENTNGEQSSNASPDANTSEAVAVTENGATDAGQNEGGVEGETNAEESAPVNETQNTENTENIEAPDIQENGESTGNSETVEKEDAGPTEETSGEGAENEEKVTEENTERTTNEPTEVISDNANKESTDTTVNTATPTENGEVNASKPIIASEIMEEEVVEFPRERRLTAYERLSNDLSGDHKTQKEITLGKRIGFYRIRGELGSGNFSQVKMGIHALTKEKVAVKILDKTKLDQKTQRLLSREISSMDKMHHPNIIRLYEVVETLAKLHIVMEYAGGGELFHKISNEGKMPESEVKIIYAQVLAALEHMHSKNVIHRDLKAENVFYAGPRFVKVGDFGFSTCSPPDQTLNTFCGSPPYAAPELFKDEHYFGAFVDIWAMGIMLYFMVCGVMPFRADNVSKLKKAILEGHFVIPNFVSDSCQFLIRGILKPIPQDRFSLVEIQRSNFLEGQEFPEELPPYNMNPSGDGAELTEEEIETRSILHDLGITEAHIIECHGKDSRSSINGTYRIVLHKVQRKRSGRVIDNGPEFEVENTIKEEPKPPKAGKKSSICVIL